MAGEQRCYGGLPCFFYTTKQDTMAAGRPILLNEDEHITHMSVDVYNYYLDAEAHLDKLENTLAVVVRENKYFYEQIKAIEAIIIKSTSQLPDAG